MKRREAMRNVALIFGGALSVSPLAVIQQGCTRSKEAVVGVFTEEDAQLLAEIGDIIIPETPDSPGAKATGIGPLIVTMLEDCYSQEDREKVSHLLSYLKGDHSFLEISSEEQVRVIGDVDRQVYGEAATIDEQVSSGYKITKELTLMGYFSSEAGATQALEYVQIPGRYEGCVNLKPGQKAWA